jgi:hypothetical protein
VSFHSRSTRRQHTLCLRKRPRRGNGCEEGRGTFRELFETFEGNVESIRVAELGWIILHRNVQDLEMCVRPESAGEGTFTILILVGRAKVIERRAESLFQSRRSLLDKSRN